MRIRRNVDERLRALERAAAGGDPDAQEAFYQSALRTGNCDMIGAALFAMGPRVANSVLGTRPTEERDRRAICLGYELVRLGYLPDIPVKAYSPYSSFTRHMVTSEPKWVQLPAYQQGRARRRRFVATYGFSYLNSWGNPEGVDSQSPTFHFNLEPLGRNFSAEEYVRSLGMDEAPRLIAPAVRPLARWDRSNPLIRTWGGGARRDVAGADSLENAVYFWTRSDPGAAESGRASRGDPDQRWQHFLSVSRAGYVPGEEIPPRPPEPYWTRGLVEEWIYAPERIEVLRALFYADLWLAGLLVPGTEVDYDPVSGGPAVRTNPWRRNADPRLRMAERRAATEQSVEALAALYRERMRAGDLHPANLWLAARIPPYNTCLAEVHAAAELAFGERIPVAEDVLSAGLASPSPAGLAAQNSEIFCNDIAEEKKRGLFPPTERLRMRLRAMAWLLERAAARTAAVSDPLSPRAAAALKRSVLSLNSFAQSRPAGVISSYPYQCQVVGGNTLAMITASMNRSQITPFTHALYGDLQRHLLRSPQ
jgi:hypothetical protein